MGAEFVRKKGKDGDVTQLVALVLGEETLEELQEDTKMTQIAERGTESWLKYHEYTAASRGRASPTHGACQETPEA